MTLTTARDVARRFTRNGIDTTAYPDAAVDYAIAIIGARLLKEARCVTLRATPALVASVATVDFTAITNFRPAYVSTINLVIDGTNYTSGDLRCGEDPALEMPDIETVRATRLRNGTTTGAPRAIAFLKSDALAATDAELDILPRAVGNLEVFYTPMFTTWTIGTASPNGVTLNIPDEILYEGLMLGSGPYLQMTEPQQKCVPMQLSAFNDYVNKCRGMGSRGAQVSIVSPTRR